MISHEPIIWRVSDGAVGPKFDQEGNIYIAEIVRPLNGAYPEEFVKKFGKVELLKTRWLKGGPRDITGNMYGSIVKFSPKGGTIDFLPFDVKKFGGNPPNHSVFSEIPYWGKPRFDPDLPKLDAGYWIWGAFKPARITGALWMAPGYSQVGIAGCNCETTRFDVDEFGRVWYPDQLLFRVRVIDTNGNPITRFGGYGNTESQGPESSIPDPEIGFTWLVGVGVTDKYIYMGDSHNRRLLRAKIVYAADETVDMPDHTALAEDLLKGTITDPDKVWQSIKSKDLDTRLASILAYGKAADEKGIVRNCVRLGDRQCR